MTVLDIALMGAVVALAGYCACLTLAIGHQHNQIATLQQRVDVNAMGLERIHATKAGPNLEELGRKVLAADASGRAN
jgi:hypothetical protein